MKNLAIQGETTCTVISRDHAVVVNDQNGVQIFCTKCGGIKNGISAGIYCQCNAPNQGGDAYKMLLSISKIISKCETIIDARNALIDLIIQHKT